MAKNSRSEEHTSELQSRLHLVCRLLLEKKKTKLNGRSLVCTLAVMLYKLSAPTLPLPRPPFVEVLLGPVHYARAPTRHGTPELHYSLDGGVDAARDGVMWVAGAPSVGLHVDMADELERHLVS